jgi:hypothetical protein
VDQPGVGDGDGEWSHAEGGFEDLRRKKQLKASHYRFRWLNLEEIKREARSSATENITRPGTPPPGEGAGEEGGESRGDCV